jgi:hypothetical protein
VMIGLSKERLMMYIERIALQSKLSFPGLNDCAVRVDNAEVEEKHVRAGGTTSKVVFTLTGVVDPRGSGVIGGDGRLPVAWLYAMRLIILSVLPDLYHRPEDHHGSLGALY